MDVSYQIMQKMECCAKWLHWIVGCLTSATYAVNFNSENVGHIVPARGIIPGDPLSHYLFLFCAKCLSSLLKTATLTKQLIGLKYLELDQLFHILFC